MEQWFIAKNGIGADAVSETLFDRFHVVRFDIFDDPDHMVHRYLSTW